ncbi:MAG: sodium-dependent transporter [Bdellovibrionales bacterium]|nr:sodium-dependent transporter [Bdellovibrionales bacterium]
MKSRGTLQTRYIFYMMALGSSFGVGNLWRFPYVTGSTGGGIFVLTYIALALVLGLPLLIAELMLGKASRQSSVGSVEFALKSTGHQISSSWKRPDEVWIGRLGLISGMVLLSYYAVVSGWVLYFCVQFFLGMFDSEPTVTAYRVLTASGWKQMLFGILHMALTGLIVARGLQAGIERAIGIVMTVFAVFVIGLVIHSLSLPGAPDAIRFLFYPNFHLFSPNTIVQALGHVFFTLSLGMGSMIAFGSYLRPEIHVPTEGFKLMAIDTLVSLLAGLLIFPIVFSSGFQSIDTPGILFETVPRMLSAIPGGFWIGGIFFLCLYCAALGASIGLLEGGVSHFVDRKKATRKNATLRMIFIVVVLSLFPALSSSVFREVSVGGMSLLQLFDTVLITVVIPLVVLGVSWIVGRRMDPKILESEFVDLPVPSLKRLYRNWIFILNWVAPILILGALLIHLLQLILGSNAPH